ncbi:hypothetical protein [Acrocarpospora sp. B8E8]|uniref:hypothetical protein n=1 Tax=Acrocarpospora sp. B8E8 TaxID=3153572 RepID=UPI00325DD6E5
MSTPRVVGLDLSLTATGIATASGDLARVDPKDLRGVARFDHIRLAVVPHVDPAMPFDGSKTADLVVIEGPSYGSMSGAGHHESAGLWWHIVYHLDWWGISYAVVPPATLKKYATGSGSADKPDMRMALFKRTGIDEKDNNKVDAAWLRMAGLDHLGHPVVELPQLHRGALAKVAWPEVSGG